LVRTRKLEHMKTAVQGVFYELAPPNYIPGQPCHGDDGTDPGWRMALETNDIKALVRALRADPRCNGKVGVVGGSAGATLAVTVALDRNPTPNGDWPKWCLNGVDDRPDCAAMLSAIYDFSDWTPPTGDNVTPRGFVRLGMQNYAQSTPANLNTLANLPLNPVVLVRQAGREGWGFKPLYLINSFYDSPTVYHQIVTMSCELEAQGLVLDTDYKRLTKPGDGHAFAYWGAQDPATGETVGQYVIDFLDAHLK
jgi:pimeloyl-ACP methyl ester carboxylesterase